ncbi:MAG TPA: peptide ABC transporter substrate-binding protein [candidate division Zixibacteria bacterium]|nr:peptide ABC transporter substrate-binding protein [candidate division Zixibacteria bacterium]
MAFALVLAACGTGTPTGSAPGASEEPGASAEPEVEQVLRIPLGGEPATLDPNRASDSVSITVLTQLVRPLVYFDQQLNTVSEGGLAESWELSDDGTQVTFTLKEGLTYSNGEPIVAEDFVYSWKRLIDPRTAADYSYVMLDVAGAEEVYGADPEDDAAVEAALENFGVEAPDERTFVVTLARPAAYFVSIATLWVTAPLKEGFEFGEAEGYVSSGPFVLEEWNHEENLTLVPNPEWTAGPTPNLERLEMPIIADPAAALAAYENDEIDLVGVPSAEVPRVRDDPDLSQQVIQGDRLSFEYYGFDMRPESPFGQSQALRHAFTKAVDKQTLIDTLRNGIGTVAGSAVPPGMPGHQPDIGLQYNLEEAQADFEQGLQDLGLSGPGDLQLQLGYNTEADHEPTVEFLQEQWRTAFDVEVELVGLEWSSYLTRLNEDPFDIFRLGWGADYPHPNNFLTDLFSCTSGNNNMQYCNEEFDDLLAQAAVTQDLEEQIPLYNQAQEILVEDAPVIPISWGGRFTLVKPWVDNLVITPQDPTTGAYFYGDVTILPRD